MRRQPGYTVRQTTSALACLLSVCASALFGQELSLGPDDEEEAAEVAELLGEKTIRDFDRLQFSHLSMLTGWKHVQHRVPVEGETNSPCHWRDDRGILAPLNDGSITTLIDVPKPGSYRLFLRLHLGTLSATPVRFSLTPQKATPRNGAPGAEPLLDYRDDGAALEHGFAQSPLPGGMSGKALEKKHPVRFERETEQISTPSGTLMAWEYLDLDLKEGVYRASLSSTDRKARVSALFLTQSKDFRPSLADYPSDNTLGHIYMRFRPVDKTAAPNAKFSVSAGLGYHWRGRRMKGDTEDRWSWPIGGADGAQVGQWSAFVDATDAIAPGPGPWSTCNLRFQGVRDGEVEVQLSWFPHDSAGVMTFRTAIGGGGSLFRVPHGNWIVTPRRDQPAWGLWAEAMLKQVTPQEAIIERYFQWADAAAARLALKPNHPRPKHIRIFSGCGVPAPNRTRAAEMLAMLGVNWIDGAPPDVIQKYGLHDESCAYNTDDADGLAKRMSVAERNRLTKLKVGDEIATHTAPGAVNSDPSKARAFRAYIEKQAAADGMTLEAFLGIRDPKDIQCTGALSDNPGRFEKRLFYHSQRFCHLTTCDGYQRVTRAFKRNFPNIHVYNNYSPHPLFLTGTTMNESDWFVLCRNQAQTLGWAEDWATGGSWGLGTSYQCTSFYAALVDCAIRKHGYPGGFYVGSNCGGSAEKIFGCIAQGLRWLHLYDWGPIDRWAEGSNAWSEHQSEYYAVLCATAALGPADEIVGLGEREARRTAILYNRSHEILTGGAGRLNHDWMWTFIGLKSSQVPVDVIIEEDLNPDDLKRYDCLVVGGFHLSKQSVLELKRWVEAGGLLLGAGGTAINDVYSDPLQEAADLFGARQRAAGMTATASVARAVFPASDWFPATELTLDGPRFLLEPTAGKTLATYAGGECAATVNPVGKGAAILLGFQPGFAFRTNGSRLGKGRAWLAAPFLKRLGRQRVEFDHPASEATLFEHEKGLAVMLASIGGPSPEGGSVLSVQTGRPIKEVVSALRGPLEWKRTGDRIEVKTRRLEPVDVVILR